MNGVYRGRSGKVTIVLYPVRPYEAPVIGEEQVGMFPDLGRVADIIREVAAEEIMPRFRSLDGDQIREKGPGDLVTIADEASERALTRRLSALLPGSRTVGEEAAAADRSILSILEGDDHVWVIDPVDGTSNFVSGRPVFAVIVALVKGGRTLAGWIYDPPGNRMAMGALGEGAHIDGIRLRVAEPAPTERMHGTLSTRFFEKTVRDHLERRATSLGRADSLQCAGQEYLRLLTGGAHFSVYRRIMPWDHAAGVLLHAEAGGHSAKLDGIPYVPTDLSGGLMLTPDKPTWTNLREALFGD